MMRFWAMGLFAALIGCAHNAPPARQVSYFVGTPYQAGGEWRYPREFTSYDMTGLAVVYGDDATTYTSDNETYDAQALAAASPVLQLPAIVTVTNLVNGKSIDVRVNDRGPAVPGRVIEVTPKVARLLEFPDGGVVEVQVTLKPQETAALDTALGQGPQMIAAPVAGITAQPLGAPGAQANGPAQTLAPKLNSGVGDASVQLYGVVNQGAPAPGPLYVQIPGFGQRYDAMRMMARLGGMPAQIVPVFNGDRTLYAINAGPFTSVEAADAALAQILADGLAAPEIIVR